MKKYYRLIGIISIVIGVIAGPVGVCISNSLIDEYSGYQIHFGDVADFDDLRSSDFDTIGGDSDAVSFFSDMKTFFIISSIILIIIGIILVYISKKSVK